ncbi:putative lipoprotein [Staphylococcus aureus]|nr:putative lipoprotein [Staphylococcus aureus]SCT18667.1 putative lipoprotein [Staphylococcus aureus]SCT19553.1 putative lipoprotein [Staphylococcus aureus]SCT28656.1 putative lipoprotein [Staphylococcus aureus]SCT43093.1 putative lipoprotein [Staphylococcus aureus]
MRKIMRILLCTSIIVSGCSFIPKNQTKDIPKTVSVKDYDGQYIGEHKKRNEVFLKKHKDEAIKKYKDYVKDTFDYDCKINLVEAYTNKSGFSEKSKTDGLVVVGTVNYDVPFQFRLIFVESGNGVAITTFTPGHVNETSAAVAAMMYKRYEPEIERARLKFKSEVEKNGYYTMNEKLQKKQEFNGVTKQFLNFNTDSIDDLDKFKKEFKPVMHLKGDAFNQQLQNLINKYPQIQKNMESEFIAYYDKGENRETVANYVWNLQKTTNDTMKLYPGNKSIIFYKDKVSASQLDEHKRLQSDSQEISISGGENDEKNDHITDLDAIELSSSWNYNSKLVAGKNALLSDSLLRDIKVLSSNAKDDADMLETELHAVINAMSQNEGKSVDALKNSTASLKNNLTKLKEQLDKTTH